MSEPETYTCAHCGETFEKGWSDEEAGAEFASDFPAEDPTDIAVICDDCHQQFKVWFEGLTPEQIEEMRLVDQLLGPAEALLDGFAAKDEP